VSRSRGSSGRSCDECCGIEFRNGTIAPALQGSAEVCKLAFLIRYFSENAIHIQSGRLHGLEKAVDGVVGSSKVGDDPQGRSVCKVASFFNRGSKPRMCAVCSESNIAEGWLPGVAPGEFVCAGTNYAANEALMTANGHSHNCRNQVPKEELSGGVLMVRVRPTEL